MKTQLLGMWWRW